MGQRAVRVPWFSWAPLALASTAAALSALWVALTPVAQQTELAGRTWDEFARQDPEVANLYSMDLVILGALGAGFGALGTAVSVMPYRRGERWAWFTLWLVPITTGVVAARMLVDRYSAGYVYSAMCAVAVVGLLTGVRRTPPA